METMKKIAVILVLTLLCFAGCDSDLSGVSGSNKDNLTNMSIDINYRNLGRVYNLNCEVDSLVYENDYLLIYTTRIYEINKDSIINYRVK